MTRDFPDPKDSLETAADRAPKDPVLNPGARLRAGAFRLMCVKPVNQVLRTVARPFIDILPWGFVRSIPMIGETELDLPDGRKIVLVSDGSDSLASRVYWSGMEGFEPESLRLFLGLLQPSGTVIDVGAHVGLYALLAATDRPDVTTIAFEPVPRNLASLRTNVSRNNASSLTVEAAAVGDTDGHITLYIPDTTRLPATASILDSDTAEMKPTDVRIVSLDTYVAEHELESVHLMKIDVEGAEADVLRGARLMIQDHQPAILCEVLHGVADTAGIAAALDGLDYRFFLVTDDGLIEHEQLVGDPSLFYKNYLLIPADQVAERLEAGLIIENGGT